MRAHELALDPPRKNPFTVFVVLIVVVAIILAVTQLNFHSILTHGQDAEAVNQCISQNGLMFPALVSRDGLKRFLVCRMAERKYGLRPEIKNGNGAFNQLTGFVFRKGKEATIYQVLEYLARRSDVDLRQLPADWYQAYLAWAAEYGGFIP